MQFTKDNTMHISTITVEMIEVNRKTNTLNKFPERKNLKSKVEQQLKV